MTPPNPKHPEQQARKQIDTVLAAAGWAIQDRKEINLAAAPGVAVREFYTKEFQAYTTPDDGRKFPELYNVVNLTHNTVDPVNKVVITTIQRLYSILKGEPALDPDLEEGSSFDGHGAALVREPPPVVYSPRLPPEFFDIVIVDECHRSIYTLWRQVLEYFDATLVGHSVSSEGSS